MNALYRFAHKEMFRCVKFVFSDDQRKESVRSSISFSIVVFERA